MVAIEYKGVTLTVSGNFMEPEPSGMDHPGTAGGIEDMSVTIGGIEVSELLEDYLTDIEEKALMEVFR